MNLARLDWEKGDGLLPAIVQDARDGRVLMLGYMNEAALRRTLADGRVTFFSRTRNELWTKGETSGHFLHVVQVSADCDNDTMLVLAHPVGPTCHKGTPTCFAEARDPDATRIAFLATLQATIAHRIAENPEGSYTARLYSQRRRPHRAEGRRGRRRDRAGRGDARRRTNWSANAPTCSTTCWCC